MSKKLLTVILLLLAFGVTPHHAYGENILETNQSKKEQCSGTIKDSSGEPIIGATVTIKGKEGGTVSDINGKFVLADVQRGQIICISYIGYEPMEIVWRGRTLDITLIEKSKDLDEVIVVGYGTQRKESLTGAMTNIKGEKLKDLATLSVENMLNGKVPGVYVAPGSGLPGSRGAIVIRGKTSLNGGTGPLWVIDGVIFGSGIGQLNPSDIESITVLKDAASTAIYGSEGANGVIVITTKKAQKGKLSININTKAGINTLSRGHLEMMNGAEYYDYYAAFQNAEVLNFPLWTPDLRNQNFDWFELAKKTGNTQDYNLSISGGDNKLQSICSLGYYNEEGAVKGYNYNRYVARLATTFQPLKWLTITPSARGSIRYIEDRQYVVGDMYTMMPWDSPYDKDGKLVPHRYSGWVNSKATNYLIDLQWDYDKSESHELIAGLDFTIKFNDWLSFTSSNSYRYGYYSSHSYVDPRSSSGKEKNGRVGEYRSNWGRRYSNQILHFQKTFGKHSVTGILAHEFNDYEDDAISASATGLVAGFDNFNATAKPEAASGAPSGWAKQSYFTQWKYSYDDRYLAEFSWRRDGRSNFGVNNRYGSFFSVSAGWNINREKWFKASWVNILKLRTSFGSVGNVPTALYPSYSLYAVNVNYNGIPGALISQIGNKDLTWEKTYSTGIGIDASFFNNRIHTTVDYYIKNTSNILYSVPISGLTGITSIWRNIGKMRNTGIEVSIGGDIIRNKNLTWSMDVNMSHNTNELRDLYKQIDKNGNYTVRPVIIGDGSPIAGSANRILEIGEPVDTYYVKEWAGVNPKDGKPMWYMNDEHGNKVTTSQYAKAKYYKCGKASPDLYGSISTNLTYKKFDLQANFGYSLGGQAYSYFRQELDSDGAYSGDHNQMKLQKGWTRWEKEGDIATHPRALFNNQDKGNLASSRYLESNDFLKLRSLTLGYNINLQRYGIQNFHISLSGENIFTINNYSGIDPELPAGYGGVLSTSGISTYPMVRKFILGVNLTF